MAIRRDGAWDAARRGVLGGGLVLFLVFVAGICLAADSSPLPLRRVLHIDSYHPGYIWSDGIGLGLRQTLAVPGQNIDLSVEHLDSRRFPGPDNARQLADIVESKYRSYRFDLVIVSDNAAFDFAVAHRDRLFPGVPLVFCGYNSFQPEVIRGLQDITGVNEEIDITGTMALALAVHPKTRTLVLITSTGDLSSARIKDMADIVVLPTYGKSHEIIEIKDASMAVIRERLAGLPPDSLVFLLGQTSDRVEGRALTPEENGRLIARASPAPVYSFWDFHMGTGALGGQILTGQDQGRAAAAMALRILSGTRAGDIPVMMKTPVSTVFDYAVMRRFQVRENQLPPGSRIINRPTSVWELYHEYIIGAVALLVLETLAISVLLLAMRTRRLALVDLARERAVLERAVGERTAGLRTANEALMRSEAKLKHLTDNMADVLWTVDRDLRFTYLSPSVAKATGLNTKDLLGLRLPETMVPASWERMKEALDGLRASGDPAPLARVEVECLRPDGGTGWMECVVRPLPGTGEDGGFLGVSRDISERKLVERIKEDMDLMARHDLKTPLTGLISIPKIMAADDNLTADQREMLDLMVLSGRKMLGQINASLEMHKIEMGTYRFHPRPCDPAALIRDNVRLLALGQDLNPEGVRVHDLRDGQAASIRSDGLLLDIVIMNLLRNAVEAGDRKAPVDITLSLEDGRLLMVFANAQAVPAEVRDQFFEKYVTRGKRRGIGLGTYSAAIMTRAMGGDIGMRTGAELGTRVSIRLPLEARDQG